MTFQDCLLEQVRLHPSMTPQDVVKMCYQAARGAEHLLSDSEAARRYFDAEYASVAPDASVPLTEDLSETVCRVNFAAWKAAGRSEERLFAAFLRSARISENGQARMFEYLQIAESLVQAGKASFSFAEWTDFLEDYRKKGMPAVHHSASYRQAERPAYRIVRRDCPDLTKTMAYAIILADAQEAVFGTEVPQEISF